MQKTRYDAFAFVIPGFSWGESDVGSDISSITSDILGISNQQNRYTRFIKAMWKLASIKVSNNKVVGLELKASGDLYESEKLVWIASDIEK